MSKIIKERKSFTMKGEEGARDEEEKRKRKEITKTRGGVLPHEGMS
jgi:hypothetical protein